MVNENFDFPDFVKKVKGVDYGIDGLLCIESIRQAKRFILLKHNKR